MTFKSTSRLSLFGLFENAERGCGLHPSFPLTLLKPLLHHTLWTITLLPHLIKTTTSTFPLPHQPLHPPPPENPKAKAVPTTTSSATAESDSGAGANGSPRSENLANGPESGSALSPPPKTPRVLTTAPPLFSTAPELSSTSSPPALRRLLRLPRAAPRLLLRRLRPSVLCFLVLPASGSPPTLPLPSKFL